MCVRRQVETAFARVFRESLSKEVAINLMSCRQPCEDLGKGILGTGNSRSISPDWELSFHQELKEG